MSRRHRQCARASDDIAGSWNHVSLPLTSESYLYMSSLRSAKNPIKPGVEQMQKHAEGQGGSCLSGLLIAREKAGSNTGIPHTPSAIKRRTKNAKTTAASPGSASALPDDVAGDGAYICMHCQLISTPGSLRRLPVMFQDYMTRRIRGYIGDVRTFCVHSLFNYIACIVAYLYT